MAKKISNSRIETNNANRRADRTGLAVIALIGGPMLATLVTIDTINILDEHQANVDRAPAAVAAAQDGFTLSYLDGSSHDRASVSLKIPSRLGESCLLNAEPEVTRDSHGKLIDLHDYRIAGLANLHQEWQGVGAHRRQVDTGDLFYIDVQNLYQLQLVAGGPQHDLCADPTAAAEFQVVPVPTD